MRLGCFVIHGDDTGTLGACLDDLLTVGDEVITIASTQSEMALKPAKDRDVRAIHHTWEGYGAARAVAATELRGCDYLFFLDADETLAKGAREAIVAWKSTTPKQRYYRVPRHDWVDADGKRFLFRTEWKKRLVRADAAAWTPAMVVHEALPNDPDTGTVDAPIDHRFATSLVARSAKNERYALLWAIQAYCQGKHPKSATLARPAHWIRNTIVKGALLRGGSDAARLSASVAHYHARKYELLRDIAAGAHADLVAAYRQGDYGALFR